MAKKYIVDLNKDEVSQLQSIIKKGKHKARTISRANIVLMASEDETDQAIAPQNLCDIQYPCVFAILLGSLLCG
ncbi:MAG: hypothetical protein KME50_37695 [Nostoc desertorum CM1-VF14]|jgi:hypothetical protein|nr:hypothetical protein [Nostoc desertorum CM1-VF14]